MVADTLAGGPRGGVAGAERDKLRTDLTSAALLIRPELLSRVNERICASGPSRRLPKGCGSPSQ
jgi:hypothetical protein